jgi:hypothetical protein
MNLNIQIRTADAKSFQREFYPAHVSRRRRTATEYIKTPLLGFVRYLFSLLRHQGPSILCLDVRQKQMQRNLQARGVKGCPGFIAAELTVVTDESTDLCTSFGKSEFHLKPTGSNRVAGIGRQFSPRFSPCDKEVRGCFTVRLPPNGMTGLPELLCFMAIAT